MSSVEESITQNRAKILDAFNGKYSLALKAKSLGWINEREFDLLDRQYRQNAVIGLTMWGMDEQPAQAMIQDQISCINPDTGEVIL